MAFQPGLNLVEVSLLAQSYGVLCQNTFGLFAENGWNQTTLDNVCLRITNWAVQQYVPALPFTTVILGAEAVDFTTATSLTGSYLLNEPEEGEIASEGAANNVSFHLNRKGPARGRVARGGVYILSVPRLEGGNNRINPTLVTQYLDAFSELVAPGFWGAGIEHVTISKRVGDNPRPEMVYFPITRYYATNNLVADMGRRLK